ncbi:hypothetical protein RCL1_008478 [Eukaryota sp. TZLM3-RCL]
MDIPNDNSPQCNQIAAEVGVSTTVPFHSLTCEECLEHFDVTRSTGLSDERVQFAVGKHGKNELTMKKARSKFTIFLLQFHAPLVYVLIGAALVTGLLKEWAEMGAIIGVILVNAIIGFVQEIKAASAVKALSSRMVSYITVRRNGQKIEIPAPEVVPGDIVYLFAGGKVPADVRLLEVHDLYIDESALTGESVPSSKNINKVDPKVALGDRKNLAFASTIVTRGSAVAIVISTGDLTEIGKINHLIQNSTEIKTPLTVKIESFTHFLLYAILGLSVISFLVARYVHDFEFIDSFLASVAVAVSAIPEGLPAAVTITLAIGVWRMAKKQAIIRVLPAVETLGSTSVICSDKTGTLTTNQMTVKQIYVSQKIHTVTGSGYAPEGEIEDINDDVIAILETGAYCNDSAIIRDNNHFKCTGDPTEGCLLVSAQKAGLDAKALAANHRFASIPFDSALMYMATLNDNPRDHTYCLHVKGALSVLEQRCSHIKTAAGIVPMTPELLEDLNRNANRAADAGLRVLAHCRKTYESTVSKLEDSDINGLTMLGFQALYDPPRETVIHSITECKAARIQVKMLTGDHSRTALAISKEIGLVEKNETRVVSGPELEDMTEEELSKIVGEVNVFARVAPEHKLRIVKALQAKPYNHTIAVTGDGTNDSPALKQADIGVAMGTGTDVAKEASDMILADDNFSTIVAAVKEGRSVFDNLVKFLLWTLPTNLAECSVIIAAIAIGTDLPLQPVHVLYINMVTAICLGLMLAFEPAEDTIMRRKPRRREKPLFTKQMFVRTLLVGGYLAAVSFFIFEYIIRNYVGEKDPVHVASSVVVTTFVVVETFYLFDCRSLDRSVFAVGLFSNPMIWFGIGVQFFIHALLLHVPFMQNVFSTVPLTWEYWGFTLAAGAGVSVVTFIHKSIKRCVSVEE